MSAYEGKVPQRKGVLSEEGREGVGHQTTDVHPLLPCSTRHSLLHTLKYGVETIPQNMMDTPHQTWGRMSTLMVPHIARGCEEIYYSHNEDSGREGQLVSSCG